MVLGLADVGSASFPFISASVKIEDSSLSAVMTVSLMGEYGYVGCGCFNVYASSNSACIAISDNDKVGIL